MAVMSGPFDALYHAAAKPNFGAGVAPINSATKTSLSSSAVTAKLNPSMSTSAVTAKLAPSIALVAAAARPIVSMTAAPSVQQMAVAGPTLGPIPGSYVSLPGLPPAGSMPPVQSTQQVPNQRSVAMPITLALGPPVAPPLPFPPSVSPSLPPSMPPVSYSDGGPGYASDPGLVTGATTPTSLLVPGGSIPAVLTATSAANAAPTSAIEPWMYAVGAAVLLGGGLLAYRSMK